VFPRAGRPVARASEAGAAFYFWAIDPGKYPVSPQFPKYRFHFYHLDFHKALQCLLYVGTVEKCGTIAATKRSECVFRAHDGAA
jgi:hypothetical protein